MGEMHGAAALLRAAYAAAKASTLRAPMTPTNGQTTDADRPCGGEPVRAKLVERAGVLPGAHARCVTTTRSHAQIGPIWVPRPGRADMSLDDH
jgi:hypothetical protein